jgi:hypothetical protein
LKKERIEKLISYHENGLSQYRMHMDNAAATLEKETVEALRELHVRVVADEESSKEKSDQK